MTQIEPERISLRLLFWTGLVAIVLVMTAPRLVLNPGLDGDAIRGMMAAESLATEWVYHPSRLPGNPLFEYLLAIVAPVGGHILANLMVLGFFFACIAAFFLIVRERKHPFLLVAFFALTPLLVVNAATTMDYIPGLAMILWSYVMAGKDRITAAFALAGLAIGFRLSNAVFLAPLGLFAYVAGQGIGRVLLHVSLGMCLGLVFYLPILAEFGLTMFQAPPHPFHGLSYVLFTGYKFLMALGPIATAGIALLLALTGKEIANATVQALRERDRSYLLEFSSALIFLLVFLLHSDESEYLIPAIPFFYLLLGRWLDTRGLCIAVALVVSFAFVSVEFKGGESGRRRPTIMPAWGIVLKDYQGRKELEALRRGVSRFADADRAVIIHGYGPVLGYRNPELVRARYDEISTELDRSGISEWSQIHRLPGRQVFLVSGMSKANAELLMRDRYRLFCFSESAPGHLMRSWGYDPYALGIDRLEILSEKAFYKRNGEGALTSPRSRSLPRLGTPEKGPV
ncbi:MAG: hypothetical protein FJ118_17585 [Deltaproteobacteria bacterium]|nr:hypothetical protein [Deltaproteobacteria bacterium]